MPGTEDRPIKLGLMAPLTGIVAFYGEEIARAGTIACEEVNQSGGLLGRHLELVILDDGSTPETAVPAALELVENHKCSAIIGNLLSNSRISVVSQVANPLKVPLLNFSFYEGSIFSRYFFHFAALPNQQIDLMIPYMVHRYGPKIFFAGHNYEWPRGSIDAAKTILTRIGGETVGEYYLPMNNEGFSTLLDELGKSGADVFVPYFAGQDQIKVLRGFTQTGLKEKMAVVMGHFDEAMVQYLNPEVRAGFYSTNTYFMSLDTPENQAYLKALARLEGVTGFWPKGNGILTNFGEGTYLCVKAFAQAVEKAGTTDGESLVQALKTVDITGPQGRVFMDPTLNHAQVNTYLSRCRADGRFDIVKAFGSIPPKIPKRYHYLENTLIPKEDDSPLEPGPIVTARNLSTVLDGGYAMTGTSGHFRWVNPSFCDILDVEKVQLFKNETLESLLFPLGPQAKQAIVSNFFTQRNHALEVSRTIQTPRGPRYIHFQIIPMDQDQGFLVKATLRQPENNRYTAKLLGDRPTGLINLDEKGHILYASANLGEIWPGPTTRPMQGKALTSYFERPQELDAIISDPKRTHWVGRLMAKTEKGPTSMGIILEKSLDPDQKKPKCVVALSLDGIGLTEQEPFIHILNIADVAILATNEKGYIVQANNRAEKLFAYESGEMHGLSIHLLVPPKSRARHKVYFNKFVQAPIVEMPLGSRGEISGYRKDGSHFPAEASVSKVQTREGTLFVATLRDITDKKEAEQQLLWQATHDPLTRLPNRRLIRERLIHALQRSIRTAKQVALLFIDLDHFKLINDSYGHKMGDEVLFRIANRLMAQVRPGDTVGRFGGDEFVVICDQVDHVTGVTSVMDRIFLALKKPLILEGHPLFITASIGISYGNGTVNSADELIRNADSAMYQAKEEGRDAWRMFNKKLHQRAKKQLAIGNGLRLALKQNDFNLVYQPILNPHTRKIRGAEVLIRWNHMGEAISPAQFIPIAEKTGTIQQIGLWVFSEACKAQSRFRDLLGDKASFYLSINISAHQFSDPHLSEKLVAIMERENIDPASILLEITESAFVQDSEVNRRILKQLGSLKLRIAIDDFGTGYSSLVQLTKLPVDYLKVDRAFISELTKSRRSLTVVRAIIRMAHALRLKVIAEGVETQNQVDALKALDCDAIQGYYFYKPLEEKTLYRMLLPA